MKQWQRIFAVCAAIVGVGLTAPAQAAGESAVAMADRSLKGDKVCTECHDENDNKAILAVYKGRHGVKADGRTPGCQTCHGASESHVKNGPKPGEAGSKRGKVDITFGSKSANSPDEQNSACTSCHERGARTHWSGSQHESRDVTCVSCHSNHVHQDKVLKKSTQAEVCYTCHKTERAQTHRMSTHPIGAGKMTCSDCHNPHGSVGPKLLVKKTLNETCFTCHAEKRGPFLWEHAPATDDCSSCHTPHGSNNAPLLKTRTPYLCQECHQDHGNSLKGGFSISNAPGSPAPNVVTPATTAGKYLTVQGNGRMCVNCHVMVHGTNHPAGAVLTR